MVFFDNVYFLVLFTFPAAVNIFYNARVRSVPIISKDKSVETAECVLLCFVVLFLNILLLKTDISNFVKYVSAGVSEDFDYWTFIVKYFICSIVTTGVVVIIFHTLIPYVFLKMLNLVNKAARRCEEKKYNDVWRNIFETKDFIDPTQCVIKIERDGTFITAGYLCLFPSPTVDKKELALCDTGHIKQLLEEDSTKEEAEKMFSDLEIDYYDIDTGTLIKFYDGKKYYEYCKKESE